MNTMAKHLCDWSYRRGGAVEVTSVGRILERGYRPDEVRAALVACPSFEGYHGGVYMGSDGDGGMWRVEITP